MLGEPIVAFRAGNPLSVLNARRRPNLPVCFISDITERISVALLLQQIQFWAVPTVSIYKARTDLYIFLESGLWYKTLLFYI